MKQVAIIGSGVAAVSLARAILRRRDDVAITLLEAGSDFRLANYRTWLDHLMTKALPHTPFMDAASDVEADQFALEGSRLFCRGGTTNLWGGIALRLKPEDFRLHSLTSRGADWPIAYADLVEWYEKAEHALDVSGESATADPPRHEARYPFPAIPFAALDAPVMDAMTALGIGYEPVAIARHGTRCMTTGTCRYCPLDARYAAGSDLDRLAAEYPQTHRLRVLLDSPVRKIVLRTRKSCAGVEYIDRRNGSSHTLDADTIVVAAGTIESAKLLLASATPDWRNGLGNQSDTVGRYLMIHPFLGVSGVMPDNRDRHAQELNFPTLVSRHFDTPVQQRAGKLFFAREGNQSARAIEDDLLQQKSPAEIRHLIETHTRLDLRGMMETFGAPHNRVAIANGQTRFGLPRTRIDFLVDESSLAARAAHEASLRRILEKAGCADIRVDPRQTPRGNHACGTCRMSDSPADGVVDADLRVHDIENLYVCSNAVFPSAAAANPTLTLVALAIRLAHHLTTA